MRQLHISHYLTNYVGDDAWIHRIRFEFRRFNYLGDVTWLTGQATAARVDEKLGPLLELEVRGTNQRGDDNIVANATVLVASRQHGPVRLPTRPAPPPYRAP